MDKSFIKLASFNCNSLRNSLDVVLELLNENDIVVLQEIMLLEDDIGFINNISHNCDFTVVPSKMNSYDGLSGRPIGGLAVLWKRSLCIDVTPVIFNDNFLVFKLVRDHTEFAIFNIYLPCDTHSNEASVTFKSILAEIESVLLDLNINNTVLIGDFNADPHKGRFWSILNNFVERLNMNILDLRLPIDTFTYLSPSHNSTSWLDHVISNQNDLITNISVGYNKTCYDHFPIFMHLNISSSFTDTSESECPINTDYFIDWNHMTPSDIHDYQTRILQNLSSVSNDAFTCKERFCNLSSHKKILRDTYSFIINVLLSSSESFRFGKRKKHKIIPGWNECCKTLHRQAREKFLIWKNSGKCRVGKEFEEMKDSRKKFKEKLKCCKRNEEVHRNAALADSFINKNMTNFWRDLKKIKGGFLHKQCNRIDGSKDVNEILNIFKQRYKSILDNNDCQRLPENFHADFRCYVDGDSHAVKINEYQVRQAVNSLNECIDFNNIHSKHLKLAPPIFFTFISKLFSAFLSHSFLPEELLQGQIRPIIKNALGDLCSSDNYRPIMISSNFLKVFEYCVLPHITDSVSLSSRQFGFRKHTSTLMAVTLFKETVHSYTSKKSVVYASFLDLSKAFDRVNYFKLISKLMKNKVPPAIVNILYIMYSSQKVYINFNHSNSDTWKIGNGVRQGGILSPLLFNIYVNDMLNEISSLKVGCKLGINNANILAYADDICILSPSARGLQILLDRLFHAE